MNVELSVEFSSEPRFKIGNIIPNEWLRLHIILGVRFLPTLDEEGSLNLVKSTWEYHLWKSEDSGKNFKEWGWVKEAEIVRAIAASNEIIREQTDTH